MFVKFQRVIIMNIQGVTKCQIVLWGAW